jgi:hypothetical protein
MGPETQNSGPFFVRISLFMNIGRADSLLMKELTFWGFGA